ncbi:MAG: hypothetical protein ACYCVL_05315 [Gemmatimonadaceae bacterium]
MQLFLRFYARALGTIGMLALVGALAVDPRWMGQGIGIGVLAFAALFLRIQQIPLTKYGALNLLGIPAVGGPPRRSVCTSGCSWPTA